MDNIFIYSYKFSNRNCLPKPHHYWLCGIVQGDIIDDIDNVALLTDRIMHTAPLPTKALQHFPAIHRKSVAANNWLNAPSFDFTCNTAPGPGCGAPTMVKL